MVDYSAVKTKAEVKTNNYEAIRWAAENGDIERLIQFENLLTDEEKKEAVEAENYGAMKSAVEGGHTAILRHFIERLNAEEKKCSGARAWLFAYLYSGDQWLFRDAMLS